MAQSCNNVASGRQGKLNGKSIVLRGANDLMLDEMDRAVFDSLCVVLRFAYFSPSRFSKPASPAHVPQRQRRVRRGTQRLDLAHADPHAPEPPVVDGNENTRRWLVA